MGDDVWAPRARTFGVFLFAFVAVVPLIVAVVFFAGGTVRAWVIPVAACAAAALAVSDARGSLPPLRERIQATLGAIAFALVATWVAGSIFDLSYDGQWYHQRGVEEFARGWNPVRDPPLGDDLWVNHYPKALWMFAAAVYRLTGNIEAGKSYQWLLLASAAFLSFAALRAYGVSPRRALVTALLLSLNPVPLAQAFSFYVDGAMGSAFLSSIAIGFLWWRGKITTLILPLCVTLVVNVKFTGLVYGAALAGGLWIIVGLRARERWAGLTVALASGFIVAVALVGFNPYVTNVLRRGHPFYPLFGRNAVDILTPNQDPAFLSKNRVVQLLLSVFAETSDTRTFPRLKVPFTVLPREFSGMVVTDTSIGGFGPLFGGAVVLAAALAFLAYRRRDPWRNAYEIASACIIASVLVIPGGWWARYVPQLWWLPVLALVFGAGERGSRWLGRVLAIVLALDVALFGGTAIAYNLLRDRSLRTQLREIAAAAHGEAVDVDFHAHRSNHLRLETSGIRYAPSSRLECPAPATLVASDAALCLHGGASPPPPPSLEQEARRLLP